MAKTEKPSIVVGVDGTEASVAALRWAVDEARATGARLEIITAFDIPFSMMIHPTKTESDYGQEARKRLDRSLELMGPIDVEFEAQVVQDRPALALTRAAEGAQLLVVGSHGYGALPGMHLGSVASYCVNHAPCPVLVHRVDPQNDAAASTSGS